MELCDVYLGLGEAAFRDLLRHVSISRLRTYQIYEHIKVRTHLTKLNSENLRKVAPRLWARLEAREEDLAADLAQAILVSHLDMIIEVLNLFGVPHQDGFFAKDMDTTQYLTGDWQQKAFDTLRPKYPESVLAFYLNHLGVEAARREELFLPAATTSQSAQ